MFNSTVKNILVVAFNKAIAQTMTSRIGNPQPLKPPTAYQIAILQAVMARQTNLVIAALVGSGKTTTLEHIVRLFPGANIRASTLHSFGFNALQYALRQRGVTKVDVDDSKVSNIIKLSLNYDNLNADEQARANLIINPVNRLVDLARTYTFGSVKPMPTDEDLRWLSERYDVDSTEQQGIPDSEVFGHVRQTLTTSNKMLNTIDFVDMINLPLVLNISFLWNDLILVDESQDLDPMQTEMIRRAANHRAQVVFVGDRNQAIYGFRGADIEAIENVIKIFKAEELPLSTCWRCPVNVIKEAQAIVPEIEAAPNAIEGSVCTLDSHDDMLKLAEHGDYVLSRTTAPVVEACMKFIRAGKAATVRGRDIGQGLDNLAKKIKKSRVGKGNELIEALIAYREDALAKLSHPSKETQRQSLSDKIDTLLVLSEECKTFDDLSLKITSIFKDVNGEIKDMILCSTAHKAKGLEAERVFIISPELMPHPMARQPWQKVQEKNLKYVAITRAMRDLYWVLDNKKKATPEASNGQPVQETKQEETKPKRKPRKTSKPKRKTVKLDADGI